MSNIWTRHEEVCGCTAIGLLMQLGVGELGCSVDCHEQIEPAFLGSHLGDVEMEVADWIGLELPLGRLVALRPGQAADSMSSEATMQG